MPLAHINTIGRMGMKCFPVTIEVDVSPGLPSFTVVGLPDTIVQEAKERIRAAIKNSGATFPLSRVTVNLAPADVKKEGVGFDLPIALGILVASEQLPSPTQHEFFYGELGLDGELKATRGVISCLRHRQVKEAYIPQANQAEASLIPTTKIIYTVPNLLALAQAKKGETTLTKLAPYAVHAEQPQYSADFADIVGQQHVKRALEIAAAGHHNVLLSGPPGTGKTLISRALPSIMPPLLPEELLEVIEIYSIAGLLPDTDLRALPRPFRSPHHSASMVAIIGGGTPPRPGEITLADHGVLFLDEFAELQRTCIEALRQPLEDRVITVARAGYSVTFPANFLLIAAVNPCPCGYKDSPHHTCVCAPQQIILYQKKLSGPILDRIDIHVTVPTLSVQEIREGSQEETSQSIQKRVIVARETQQSRYHDIGITTNSQLSSKHITKFCPIEKDAQDLLDQAIDRLKLSMRSYHRTLKVAQTISDLTHAKTITTSAISEALRYRPTTVSV